MLGLKEDGVGWALDDDNKALITPEMKAAADKARADIIAGAVKVHDYMSDECLPVLIGSPSSERTAGRKPGGFLLARSCSRPA